MPPRASAKKFPGVPMGKTRPKHCTSKPLSTLTVLCMKIQGGTAPRCRRLCIFYFALLASGWLQLWV